MSVLEAEPTWLVKAEIITIHAMQIRQYGGSYGIRDSGLLESALAKPKHLYQYDKPTLHQLAAKLGFGIIKNHPFIDGNKRTGIISAGVFLIVNSVELKISEPELVGKTLEIAAGNLSEIAFCEWLESNSIKL